MERIEDRPYDSILIISGVKYTIGHWDLSLVSIGSEGFKTNTMVLDLNIVFIWSLKF